MSQTIKPITNDRKIWSVLWRRDESVGIRLSMGRTPPPPHPPLLHPQPMGSNPAPSPPPPTRPSPARPAPPSHTDQKDSLKGRIFKDEIKIDCRIYHHNEVLNVYDSVALTVEEDLFKMCYSAASVPRSKMNVDRVCYILIHVNDLNWKQLPCALLCDWVKLKTIFPTKRTICDQAPVFPMHIFVGYFLE